MAAAMVNCLLLGRCLAFRSTNMVEDDSDLQGGIAVTGNDELG